jgi:FixJ family two-component response regulator
MIAIVDDDESMRESTQELVSSLGYRVAAFASAEEFLLSEEVERTRCLIADVRMPGLSGIDLQSRLVAQGACVPTIFITAFPEERTRLSALKAGAVGYLGKPFSEESLVKCLNTALGSSDGNIPQR